ncbi:hypothetical protein, partial [Sphingomonas sp. SAFR-052]|uniref:hypothetical protein n=1 Tax=Sphingomonas sp. SAFR-052 TaxID=3436867 RepID=UPI003F7E760B
PTPGNGGGDDNALTNMPDHPLGAVQKVFRTTMPVEQVVSCFETKNNKRAIERADGARVVRFRNGYGGVERTFSIYPEGTGSRIEVRKDFLGGQFIRWRSCVGLQDER